MMPSDFIIRVPCSSANIGPGFDVLGLALSLYLDVGVSVKPPEGPSKLPLNCSITCQDECGSGEDISLDPEVNLITRVALYVLRCHGQRAFPAETHVHTVNRIPLGRGLGSSGAAVVAGVMLGNEVGKLELSKARMLDYCLMIGMCLKFRFPL
jgi:homoserine kinase